MGTLPRDPDLLDLLGRIRQLREALGPDSATGPALGSVAWHRAFDELARRAQALEEDCGYNGWLNHATWATDLHLSNTQELARHMAQLLVAAYDQAPNWYRAGDALEAELTRWRDERLHWTWVRPAAWPYSTLHWQRLSHGIEGLFGDLLRHALGQLDYPRLAQALAPESTGKEPLVP